MTIRSLLTSRTCRSGGCMQHEDNDSASWERATVVEVGKKITVEEADGTRHEVARSNEKILPSSITASAGAPNMIDLDVLHEGAIQENIRVRYYRDDIYTLVGPILISVNPYRVIQDMYVHTFTRRSPPACVKPPPVVDSTGVAFLCRNVDSGAVLHFIWRSARACVRACVRACASVSL